MLRRVLAVTVDFFVLYLVWVVVGAVIVELRHPEYSSLGLAVYFLAIDLPLTALYGASAGRFLSGIRVRRTADGREPGWARAALRIVLVVSTAPAGFLYWSIAHAVVQYLDPRLGRFRLWWDVAAGTELVRRPRAFATQVESGSTRR